MSNLNELIAAFCPDGVKRCPLGEYAELSDGFPFNAKDFVIEGKYPVIKITDIQDGKVFIGKCFLTSIPAKVKDEQILRGGEILVGMSGSTGKTGYNEMANVLVNQRIAIIRHIEGKIINGYLKHLLVNSNFEKYCFENGTGPQNNIGKAVIGNYLIPVPPLEVQDEIVRILDNFTELTAELTAELDLRKKQYEFYRDSLLSFEKNGRVKRVKLGDIATDFYRGSGIKRDEVTEEGIPCVRYGEIYTSYNIWFDKCISHTKSEYVSNPKYFEYGDILFAITGESVEDIAKSTVYVGNEKCLAGGDIVVMKHNQNPKYLSYALSTTAAQAQKSKGKVKSKVVHSNVPSIQEIEIPLPSLEVQERIVTVLDNFDAICSDLKIGLPAEIEARQKQYEYYRDLLLSFDYSQSVNVERERERERERESRSPQDR